jgi:drug/metabolite transporter superfamily protein YnfA
LKKTAIIAEFWDYLRLNKKWWLVPVVLSLLLAGVLLFFSQSPAAAPFIYSLF